MRLLENFIERHLLPDETSVYRWPTDHSKLVGEVEECKGIGDLKLKICPIKRHVLLRFFGCPQTLLIILCGLCGRHNALTNFESPEDLRARKGSGFILVYRSQVRGSSYKPSTVRVLKNA